MRTPIAFRTGLAALLVAATAGGAAADTLEVRMATLAPDGGFGLIDFLDVHFRRGPLSARLVRRNLGHLQGYLQRSKVDDFPWESLMSEYSAHLQVMQPL